MAPMRSYSVHDMWSVGQAVIVRIIFICHALLTVWRTADVRASGIDWLLTLPCALLVLEGIATIVKRKGQELKWFSPCILLYLTSTVPSICLLELDRLNLYNNANTQNITNTVAQQLSELKGITLPLKLSSDIWVKFLEQSLLLILILARWILPKGEITRDQLSQVLFVYIGMSSDVMELFVMFEEDLVLTNNRLCYAILAIWSLSLIQFSFVLTVTRNPAKTRAIKVAPTEENPSVLSRTSGIINESPDHIHIEPTETSVIGCSQASESTHSDIADSENGNSDIVTSSLDTEAYQVKPRWRKVKQHAYCNKFAHFCLSEIWSILFMLCLQDVPFLIVRLYALIRYNLVSYNILFFTAKNMIIIMLMFYRLFVISMGYVEKKQSKRLNRDITNLSEWSAANSTT